MGGRQRGAWNTTLKSEANGAAFTLTLNLKRARNQVTSYESNHVGAGQISRGTWAANKLRLTLATNHGAIVLMGALKQGKLAGQFDAGQMRGSWEANRR